MLNVAASPTDKTYANQLNGAALLEPIFKRQPLHPGVAHYLIHLYDYPAIAKKGSKRPSATPRCARLRSATHAVAHIHAVGYWKESIKSNTKSTRIAKLDGETHDQGTAWTT